MMKERPSRPALVIATVTTTSVPSAGRSSRRQLR